MVDEGSGDDDRGSDHVNTRAESENIHVAHCLDCGATPDFNPRFAGNVIQKYLKESWEGRKVWGWCR